MKELTKNVRIGPPVVDLMAKLKAAAQVAGVTTSVEKRKLQHLHDLLQKLFTLDPAQRLRVEQALHHPFVKED